MSVPLRAAYAARGLLSKYKGASLRASATRSRTGAVEVAGNESPFRWTGRTGILKDAIEFRQEVAFWYSNKTAKLDGRRTGNPHALINRGGVTYLLMYTSPASSSRSRRLPGWRTFILNRIRNPQIVVQAQFAGNLRQFPIAPGYRRFRRGRFIARV